MPARVESAIRSLLEERYKNININFHIEENDGALEYSFIYEIDNRYKEAKIAVPVRLLPFFVPEDLAGKIIDKLSERMKEEALDILTTCDTIEKEKLFDNWFYNCLRRYGNSIVLKSKMKAITTEQLFDDIRAQLLLNERQYINIYEPPELPGEKHPHFVVTIMEDVSKCV